MSAVPTRGRAPFAALAAALLVPLAVIACAQPGMPPGGPPDKVPPKLTGVSPDTGALNVRQRAVLLRFDEVVNERSTPLGGSAISGGIGGGSGNQQMGSTLGSLVLLSPGDGRERVSWRRTAIEIEPRGGFRANTTYRVTLLPGLADLRGNVLREPVEVVFSTGASRTESVVRGAIFDWVAAKPAALARVELFAANDTMMRWTARADSGGRFAVRDLAPGSYRLRGWIDQNQNRALDTRELFDSLTVTVDTAATTELYAFLHDTLGPRIESVEVIDSTAIKVKFDRGVATDWSPDSTTARLQRADSSVVALLRMIPATLFDSLQKAALAAADTTAPDSAEPRVPAPGAPPAPGGRTPPRITVLRDSADSARAARIVPPPQMSRPAPIQQWVVRYAAPLPPGDYRVRFSGIRGLNGATKPSEREFKLRPPPAPADTTRPPATGTRPPATRPPENAPTGPRP